MTLFDRVFGGNDYNYTRTVAAIDAAIAQYGEAEPVAFPATAYNLPCYYSITGKKVNNLGELKAALENAKKANALNAEDKYSAEQIENISTQLSSLQ